MKRSLTAYIIAAVCALTATSCHKTLQPDSSFVDSSSIQLSFKGKKILEYCPATFQLAFKASRKEFRMFDDQMKRWCIVTCSELPSEQGQKIDATVSWSTPESDGQEKVKMEVVKAVGDEYWLWCGNKNKRLAVTVCRLD